VFDQIAVSSAAQVFLAALQRRSGIELVQLDAAR
jgi:hypothetical protein